MNHVENRNKNNKVVLTGKVTGAPVYSHEVFGECFYVFDMDIQRTSGIIDTVPVMVSERMCNIEDIKVGNSYEIIGQFRSYNKKQESKSHLLLSVFTAEMRELDEEEFVGENSVVIYGYICKEPVYRKTPLGREIADLLLAVNRAYNKSDYIPCIAWGRNARFVNNLGVGEKISLTGRIQSREYQKKISEDNTVTKTAYEISISSISLSEEETEDSTVEV